MPSPKRSAALYLFAAYVVLWIVTALQLWDMHKTPYAYGDGKLISFLPILVVFGSAVYVAVLVIMAMRPLTSAPHKALCKRLALIAAIPVLAFLLLVATLR